VEGLGKVQARIATWRGDARAAYSIIHDDLGSAEADGILEHAGRELEARGLTAAAAAIAAECEKRALWGKLEHWIAAGNEVASHSLSHVDQVETPSYEREIDEAKRLLDDRLGSERVRFFVFPYDSYDAPAIAHLSIRGYLGARAGERGLNAPDFADPLRVNYDAYGPEYSVYEGRKDLLSAYVDDAIACGGWAVRELHGVEDSSWESIPLADYRAHLDRVKTLTLSGELWMATPCEVIRYRLTREARGSACVRDGVLGFAGKNDPLCDATPITVVLSTERDAPRLDCRRGDHSFAATRVGPGKFMLDVDPNGLDVGLSAGSR
jgi:peptidoglycan/xylan/chitin deacetylase (PgdA/CDA1 family)